MKGKYGAFLMEQNDKLVYSILTELRKSLPDHVAVSAKIRLPSNDQLLRYRIEHLIDTGINFLTIHGRTIKENKTAVKQCHYDQIQLAVQIAQQYYCKTGDDNHYFPIIANGGIETYDDIEYVKSMTGAAAIMSSEALLETPNLFTQKISRQHHHLVYNDNSPPHILLCEQQFQFAFDYLQWCQYYPPLPGVLGLSMNIVRGHLFKFLFRYLNTNIPDNIHVTKEQEQFRNELASGRQLNTLRDAEEYVNRLYNWCKCQEVLLIKACFKESSWYRRHWNDNTAVTVVNGQSNNDSSRSAINNEQSIEERKAAIKNRITKLREQIELKERKKS